MTSEPLDYRVKHLKRNGTDAPRERIVAEALRRADQNGQLDILLTHPSGKVRQDMLAAILRATVETTADHLLGDRPFAPDFAAGPATPHGHV